MDIFDNPDRLLSRREVERIFGLSARFLELAATRGDGPAITRIGRSVRYRVADVRGWIASRRNGGSEMSGAGAPR